MPPCTLSHTTLLTYLSNSLKGYGCIGVGRDDGRMKGEYACIFYDSSRYEKVRDSTFWLSPTPDVISRGWDAAIKRGCTHRSPSLTWMAAVSLWRSRRSPSRNFSAAEGTVTFSAALSSARVLSLVMAP